MPPAVRTVLSAGERAARADVYVYVIVYVGGGGARGCGEEGAGHAKDRAFLDGRRGFAFLAASHQVLQVFLVVVVIVVFLLLLLFLLSSRSESLASE